MFDEYFNKRLTTKGGVEFPYHEKLDAKGYVYAIAIEWRGEQIDVIITNSGVSLNYVEHEKFVHTNIVPKRLFGETSSLNDIQLKKILALVKMTGGEGKSFDIQEQYDMWVRLGKP